MSATERTIKTKIDGDAAGLRRAAREAEREIKRIADLEAKEAKRVEQQQALAQKAQAAFLSQTAKGADALSSVLAKGVTGILKVGAAAGSAQGLAGAAGALSTLSGAGLALPGVLLAGAAGMATFKLATAGFSDAVKADDLKAFTEATKDMAPSAVATAVAVRDQREAFTDLRKEVQGNFFDGFDQDVRDLAGTYLPVMKTGLGGIATEMNAMGRATAGALLEPSAVQATNKVLGGTKDLFHELEPAVGNVLTGILGLGGEGAEELGGLGKAITGVTEDFKDWVDAGVESGRINEIIDDGVEAAKKLGAALTNVGQIGGKLFSGLSAGGGDFLDGLVETTQAVEDFLDSVEGQSAIKELGETLGVVADVARNVLSAALHEVGPIITELAPAAREVATAVGEWLVQAIQAVGPLLADLAGFLSDNKEAVGDLVPLLLGAAVAYKGLKVATEVKGWLSGLPSLFDDVGRAATRAGDGIGDAGSGKGLVGRLGGLKGVGAGLLIGGVVVALDEINQAVGGMDPNKVNAFGGALDSTLKTASDLATLDFASVIKDVNKAFTDGASGFEFAVKQYKNGESALGELSGAIDRFKRNVSLTPIVFAANTDPARHSVDQLLVEVNDTAGTVEINGNRNPAGFALRQVLAEIAAGKETVTINGQAIPAQQALDYVIGQINKGSGTVNINGNEVPAGAALAGMIQTINGSSGTVTINANDSAARGVVNSLVQDINGRQVQIFVNAVGDRGGLASAGRLATGGQPRPYTGRVRGPGTGKSDTAGLFWLSNNEHVLTDAEVRAAGGHAAVYRLRRALLSGRIPGFATGGSPGVPSYLSASTSLPRPRSSSVNVAAPNTAVTVLIDGREVRAIVQKTIDDTNRSARTAVRAGSGRGW